MAHVRVDPTLDAFLRFDGVGLAMPRKARRKGRGRRGAVRRMAGDVKFENEVVLEDVNFAIQPGESVAVLAPRSSGRVELLRLAAATLLPDEGTVRRREAMVPMLDVSRTFSRGFTVRENIYVTGSMLGIPQQEMAELVPQIAERARVVKYLDSFLGGLNYTHRQRMAWSIAMATNARGYVIDNILEVGSPAYRAKCLAHAQRLRADGVTFLMVSDVPDQVRAFCDRALLIQGNQVVESDIETGLEWFATVSDMEAPVRDSGRAERDEPEDDD
jgi:ABC-type polysaccharide/polyol phosphate transport system ATPase subunit